MARDTKTVTLDKDVYQITQLGAIEGSDIYHDLVRYVGPTLLEAFSTKSEGGAQEDKENAALKIGTAMAQALGLIPKEVMRDLRTKFSQNTKFKAGEIFLPLSEGDSFDQQFAGRYKAMTAWLLAALKVNFADFLESEPSEAPKAQTPQGSK